MYLIFALGSKDLPCIPNHLPDSSAKGMMMRGLSFDKSSKVCFSEFTYFLNSSAQYRRFSFSSGICLDSRYFLAGCSLFSDKINKRFNVKPGVTGYSQINGRNLLNWEKKIELDNIYIDKYNNYGIIIDFIILIKTIYVIFTMKGSIEKNNG